MHLIPLTPIGSVHGTWPTIHKPWWNSPTGLPRNKPVVTTWLAFVGPMVCAVPTARARRYGPWKPCSTAVRNVAMTFLSLQARCSRTRTSRCDSGSRQSGTLPTRSRVRVLSVSSGFLAWAVTGRHGIGCTSCGARWSDRAEIACLELSRWMKPLSGGLDPASAGGVPLARRWYSLPLKPMVAR